MCWRWHRARTTATRRARHNAPEFASSSFGPVAPHLWEMAKLGPKDVDVLQSYENFTGGVLMSLTEHGFFKPEEANEFLTLDNLLAPDGQAAAQHERRQPGGMLHARARAADRGGAPAARHSRRRRCPTRKVAA